MDLRTAIKWYLHRGRKKPKQKRTTAHSSICCRVAKYGNSDSGATYFPPLVQQPDESTVAPLSNHVHASYRGTSLYRLTIDSGGRIVFCAVLPEHTCTVA